MMRSIPLSIVLSYLAGSMGATVGWSQVTQQFGQQPAQPPQARVARQQPVAPPQAPFTLTAEQQAKLDQLLLAWEQQSSQTKTLACQFQLFDYDTQGAPAGVPASKSVGIVRYAKPDRGLFRVDQKVFFQGFQDQKPQYQAMQGKFGDYWVCDGKSVIELDRGKKEYRIQQLPPEMQGKGIIESPLPFVFNLKAAEIKERYWVRQVKSPQPDLLMIEAWPKRQEDLAQYKLVQIVLQTDKFLPAGLVLYAPNFNVALAPHRQIYEFTDVKQNSFGNNMQMFMNNFIPEKAPRGWKVFNEKFPSP